MGRDNSWGVAAVHGLASPIFNGSNLEEHNIKKLKLGKYH